VLLAVLVPSIILHEVSHGVAALAFGDETAKRAGRLTLNPIAHIDPFGTIILPAMMILTTGSGFGFAKPVPVNPRNMRNPRNDGFVVSLAGPATNIVIALLSALAVRALMTRPEIALAAVSSSAAPVWQVALINLGLLNVILAAFNLLPIPPLDGSAFIERALPARWWPAYLRVRMYSMAVLFALVFLFPRVLSTVFDHAIDLWSHLLR
jgi:Zn-dependent protease